MTSEVEYHDVATPACGRCNVCGVCSRWYHGSHCPCQDATVAALTPRCSCGNSFTGDNLCMPSACQWEGA